MEAVEPDGTRAAPPRDLTAGSDPNRDAVSAAELGLLHSPSGRSGLPSAL